MQNKHWDRLTANVVLVHDNAPPHTTTQMQDLLQHSVGMFLNVLYPPPPIAQI